LYAEEFAVDSLNVYSRLDFITGGFGRVVQKKGTDVLYSSFGLSGKMLEKWFPYENERYNIKFVPCISTWSERTGYLFDHAKGGSTYRAQEREYIEDVERRFGFSKENR
jgi:hypothetical protein